MLLLLLAILLLSFFFIRPSVHGTIAVVLVGWCSFVVTWVYALSLLKGML